MTQTAKLPSKVAAPKIGLKKLINQVAAEVADTTKAIATVDAIIEKLPKGEKLPKTEKLPKVEVSKQTAKLPSKEVKKDNSQEQAANKLSKLKKVIGDAIQAEPPHTQVEVPVIAQPTVAPVDNTMLPPAMVKKAAPLPKKIITPSGKLCFSEVMQQQQANTTPPAPFMSELSKFLK